MPAVIRIERPASSEYAPYYGRYIERVPGDDALEPLTRQIEETTRLLRGLPDAQALHRYAPGKWSVKETLTHLTDAERVFSYRALRFARQDETPLPGFDENVWAQRYRSDARPIADLVDEYRAVRAATIALLKGLEPDELGRIGTANGNPMSARGAAWVCAGHELHHVALLRERYGIRG